MGSSFVRYKEYGYWVRDGFLEGLLFMLARELNRTEEKEDWLKKLIDDWNSAAKVGFSGCVPSHLDKYFTTPSRLNLLKITLNRIVTNLETDEDFLTLSDLNDNGVGAGGWHKIRKDGFKSAARLMLDLINGRCW